jgi:hypothetical protein
MKVRWLKSIGSQYHIKQLNAYLQLQEAASELKARRIHLHLQWIPGHSDRNNAADKLAKIAVSPDKMHLFCRLVSQERRLSESNFSGGGSMNGKHPKKVLTSSGLTLSCQPSARGCATHYIKSRLPTYPAVGWLLLASALQ